MHFNTASVKIPEEFISCCVIKWAFYTEKNLILYFAARQSIYVQLTRYRSPNLSQSINKGKVTTSELC